LNVLYANTEACDAALFLFWAHQTLGQRITARANYGVFTSSFPPNVEKHK